MVVVGTLVGAGLAMFTAYFLARRRGGSVNRKDL